MLVRALRHAGRRPPVRLHAGAAVARRAHRGAVGGVHAVLRQAPAVRPVSGASCLGDALTKLVIPAPEAGRIRDQLDLVSVDERRLFPDLDGVAGYLRRYYS